MRKLARLVLFAVALSAGWAAVSTAYALPPQPCFQIEGFDVGDFDISF